MKSFIRDSCSIFLQWSETYESAHFLAVANASPFQASEQSHKPLYKMNLKYSHCKKSICRRVVYVMPICLAGKRFTDENFSHQLLSKEQLDGIKTSGLWLGEGRKNLLKTYHFRDFGGIPK